MSEEKGTDLVSHLEELRSRLLKCLLVVGIMFVVAWVFRGDILYILKKPLVDALPPEMRNVILLRIMDKFFVHLKTSLIAALALSAPYVFYQLWRFVAPGLYKNEKRVAFPFLFFSIFFFFGGMAFCYFVLMPFGFQFLVNYSIDSGTLLFDSGDTAAAVSAGADLLQISLSEHISFTGTMLMVFGVAFETPLFIFVVCATGLVSPDWFARMRRYAIVGAFIIGAILTPPDPWSQISLALPMVLLYEVGIWASRLLLWKRRKAAESGGDHSSDRDTSSGSSSGGLAG
mgnify:FL=1